MEKIIQTLINSWTKGVDTYTHNGSTWLIFTDNKQWVIELTDAKTLWYNYNFFNQIFEFTSLDVVEHQQYITKWVEDNIINGSKNGVNHITSYPFNKTRLIEDAIQNGVKETRSEINITEGEIEDIIDGGVKETIELMNELPNRVKKIIKKGVKLTQFNDNENKSWVEGVIKGGVKHTEYGDWLDGDERLDEIVENGVKETIECDWNIPKYVINEVIIEGVKETNHVDVMKFFDNKMEDTLKNGVRHTLNTEYMPTSMVEDIIQNGVKETKTPGKDGDILSTIEWMEENKSTSYTKMINDVLDNGEKINGTYAGGQRQSEKCKSVVEYGTKNPTD